MWYLGLSGFFDHAYKALEKNQILAQKKPHPLKIFKNQLQGISEDKFMFLKGKLGRANMNTNYFQMLILSFWVQF